MAGSPRNPLMNEQWRADDDHRESQHHHPRQRERARDKPNRRQRSPPFPRRGRGRDRDRSSRGRGFSSVNHQPLGRHSAPRRGDKKVNSGRGGFPLYQQPTQPEAQDLNHQFEQEVRSVHGDWDDRHFPPPSHPPPKRRRTRSPSPYRGRFPRSKKKNHRNRDRPERGRKRPTRGGSPRGLSRREEGQRPHSRRSDISASDSFAHHRHRHSGSPPFEDDHYLSPREEVYGHPIEGGSQREYPSLSPPHHSVHSKASIESFEDPGMHSTRPIQSIMDDSGDASTHPRETFPMHRPGDGRGSHRPPRPHVETRQSFASSPQYVTPVGSRHGSPQSGSPYSAGRGSWGGQQQPYRGQQRQMHGYSPPYRQGSFPNQDNSQAQHYPGQQGQYVPSSSHPQSGYAGPSYRGGHSNYRGGHYNQNRISGPNSQGYNPQAPQRNRGAHFSNLQWTASSGRGRGAHQTPPGPHQQPPAPMPAMQHPPIPDDRMSLDIGEDDNPFRPSKDLQVEDENTKRESEDGGLKKIPPPSARQPSAPTQPKETGKFSFAFKSKAAPPPTPKPVPDLAQRMREPPPRAPGEPRNRKPLPFHKDKHDNRPDRKDDRRDFRRNDRRFDHRAERNRDRREERRMDARHDRRHDRHDRHDRRERSPVRKKPKKTLKRMKPRPILTEEFAESDSVYYRKPGNESVIGAGTYGKVFKAVHVYTENKVALKKIRMEGEKDGFPITAVREIRLLQHLRHDNVVRLQEVMVEKNECFMVFEYLSHDLTGLINHPTFALTPAHKKHLAKQMFEGLGYLHNRGVLHRDIKAANILISNQGELKFADFGLARFFSKSRQLDYTNRVITIWYRPPELLLGETRYGPAVDVWSAACVYVEMFTKKAVFPGEGGEISQLDKLYTSLGTPTRTDWPDIVDMPWFELLRPRERKVRTFEDVYKEFLSPAALDLVAKMFQYDPAKRPSAEEVLTHPYFTSEEPLPQQAIELSSIEGDWHEFESKAHRKEKGKEARRAEYQREKEKRRASSGPTQSGDREPKRTKLEEDASQSQGLEN